MTLCAVVRSVTAHGLSLVVGPQAAVSVGAVRTVVLTTGLAVIALEAGTGLGTDTYTVALLDVLDVLANADGLANDFVTDAAWVGCGELHPFSYEDYLVFSIELTHPELRV